MPFIHRRNSTSSPESLPSISDDLRYSPSLVQNYGQGTGSIPYCSALTATSGCHLSDLQDLELFHHYTTVVCFSISDEDSKQQVWRDVVSREALKYKFLMHAILAVAALPLTWKHPDRSDIYRKAARTHQTMALRSSLPHFARITPANCDALFALANIIGVLAFAFPHDTPSGLQLDPLDHILDFFMIIRGIKTVLGSASEWIVSGPLAELFRRDWLPTKASLPEDVESSFDGLVTRNLEAVEKVENQQWYSVVIEDLRTTFQTSKVIFQEPGMVFVWPVRLPEQYSMALRKALIEREPMALAILAHYAVLLHSTSGLWWWVQDQGRQLIERIRLVIPTDWLPLVTWPTKALHDNSWQVEIMNDQRH